MNATVSDTTQRYVEAWKQFDTSVDGNVLSQFRQTAIDQFAKFGFPDKRIEEWKYTNLRRLERREFTLAKQAQAPLPDAATLPLAKDNLPTLAFVNGQFVESLSRTADLPAGVQARSIADLLSEKPTALTSHIESSLNDNGRNIDSLAALNTAFLENGAAVHIDAHVQLSKPLHLLFISQRVDDAVVSHPRVVITLDKDSEATIIEHHIGLDEAANFTNTVAEIVLGDNARLQHYRIQEESPKSFHISNTRVHQQRDSHYGSLNVDIGGLLVRHDLHSHMDGINAETLLDGLFVLDGVQHCDNHTYVHHTTPRTHSRERYKGILDGRSKGIYNGMVYVAPDAQKIDSKQSSHNLLLSNKAEIDTKPELEIYADDVKCDHGATVGQLDDTALFYLQSRGVNIDDARKLLVVAFARELLDPIKHDILRGYLEQALLNALGASSA